MSREALEFWRTVVPGALILAYLYFGAVAFGIAGSLGSENWFLLKREVVLTIVALIFGFVYRAIRARDRVFRPPIERVQANIKARLTDKVRTDPYFSDRLPQLLEGRKLMEVFYNFVDRDSSLTEKAKGVRANGLALSSAADCELTGLAFGTLFVAVAVVGWGRGLREAYVVWGDWRISSFALLAVVAFALSFVGRRLLVIFERRHLELSNEQLDYIDIHFKDELRDSLYKL